ncbi:MAG: PAS domain S-box protein [Deltaproteobacteria bacterium]|nr:PAS domain S-box protein [Deltaproteobacteria bacterium]
MASDSSTKREISCRITRTLIMYVRETHGSLGNLLEGLDLSEAYLLDTNNWVSHELLHILYARMIDILGDNHSVYKMTLAAKRFQSLGLLDWIARLLGNPKLIYAQAPKYNRLLKANGDVYIHELGDSWVVLEDRYHDSAQKTRYDCDYTRGVLAGIPTLFDMPFAQVEEIECQVAHEVYGERIWPDAPVYGARGCLYRIRWDPKDLPPVWKRLFQRYSVYRKAIDNLQEANRVIQEKYDEVKRLALELETANRHLTESKRQLENYTAELHASERRYRLLAENVTDTIWVLSLDTLHFTYVSPSVKRQRGYSVEEAMALPLEKTVTAESLEQVLAVLEEELVRENTGNADPNRSRTIEVQQYHKDGSSSWAEVTTSFLRDDEGKAEGVLGVTRDASERKRAEQLYQAKIAAEASNAAKSAFLSRMSHELRTPLNHIMGFTELILDKHCGDLNETQEEYLEDVYRSSQHLLALVNEILDVSKIEAGKLELKPTSVNLKLLLEQSLSIVMDKAMQRKIHLHAKIGDVPDAITADELRLKQILYNLLSNAVKFTEDGGNVTLEARLSASSREGNRIEAEPAGDALQIDVIDTGIGIRQEDLAKIFEPFSQLESPLSRRYPGSGLGLWLTRNLVEMHGGRIWAESEGPGKGAVFRFTLPF